MNRHFFAHLLEFAIVVILLLCVLAISSDGRWFPYINLAGLLAFAAIVLAVFALKRRPSRPGLLIRKIKIESTYGKRSSIDWGKYLKLQE